MAPLADDSCCSLGLADLPPAVRTCACRSAVICFFLFFFLMSLSYSPNDASSCFTRSPKHVP